MAEQEARGELDTTEADFEGWQDVLRTAIRLAGNCHAAYLKARPSGVHATTTRCSRPST